MDRKKVQPLCLFSRHVITRPPKQEPDLIYLAQGEANIWKKEREGEGEVGGGGGGSRYIYTER